MFDSTDFVSAFRGHAAADPARTAVTFAEPARSSCTYGGLDRAARALAAVLARSHRPGERVLLPMGTGAAFVKAFLGCQYAGLVPVPVPAGTGAGTAGGADRTIAIARDAGAVSALMDADVERAEADGPGGFEPAPRSPADLAFLQYTSGSTSEPKGVMITHGNLLCNLELMRREHGWHRGTGFCGWLPVHHDMGLIAMILMPLYLGAATTLMTPTGFLKRPHRWLELIDRHGAEVSCAPNFAYDLCTRRVTDEQIAALDLSRWRCACNGAEPVDAGTLERFAARFAPAGFRPEALLPGYGLAEATLYVTGTRVAEPPTVLDADAAALERGTLTPAATGTAATGSAATGTGVRRVVASGAVRGADVRIVDPETSREVPDGRVGEVWVRGGGVAQGYWGRPEETRRTFGAVTASGAGGFLRTGDLGALRGGALFVTGRRKELLIVHGRNLYPHDVERDVGALLGEAEAGLPRAVFSVPAPREEIVVVQEVRSRGRAEAELAALARRIRDGLGPLLGTRVAAVSLVRIGQVRRTTSGKVRRGRMRELFMAGGLRAVFEDLDAETAARYRTPPASAGPAESAVPAASAVAAEGKAGSLT